MVIYSSFEQHILSFLELAYLSFLLLFRVFQSDFDEIPSHTRISISICVQNPVVQFSMTKRRVFSGLPIIADRFSFVKPFLEIFSNFFFARKKTACFRRLDYYTSTLYDCQPLFIKKFNFFKKVFLMHLFLHFKVYFSSFIYYNVSLQRYPLLIER